MGIAQKRIKNYSILFILMACSLWLAGYSYAQEQNIAESFGLHSKGIDYYHKGKLYEAKDILEQAVRIDPRNDEAQGYLDLVNAEINMRKQGRLSSYQDMNSFRRETDLGNKEQYNNDPGPQMQPFDEPGDSEEYVEEETAPAIKPLIPKIRGGYKMSIGVTSEDLIWKQANGDYNERNFRMIDHNLTGLR
jgi:tetratricopeptide (TPR) repeat protein